jgi:hypothetical protein
VTFHIFELWKRKEAFHRPDVEYEFQFRFGNPKLDHGVTVKYCIGNRRLELEYLGSKEKDDDEKGIGLLAL